MQIPAARILTPALCVAVAVFGLWLGSAFRQSLSESGATLDVEAQISKGRTFRIYYNNQWSESQTAAIRPGEWTHYTFRVPSRITALRFDPSEDGDAAAYIRSISIGSRGTPAQTIDVTHLLRWIGTKITASRDGATGSVLLVTTSAGAYWMGSEDITVPSRYGKLAERLHFRLDPGNLLRSLILAVALFLVVGIRRAGLFQAIFISFVICAAIAAASILASELVTRSGPLPPVDHAVGAAALTGLSLSAELLAANLSFVCALALALVGGLAWHKLRFGTLLPTETSTEAPVPLNRWIVLAFVGLLAVFAFPPAGAYLRNAALTKNAADSDSQTVMMWQFLIYRGFLPWRDFWFPYGGFYDRFVSLYPYFIYEFLHRLALIAVVVWSGLQILSNRWRIFAGFCCLYLILGAAGVINLLSGDRYLLSVSLLLVCAVTAQRTTYRGFCFLGLWCAYVLTQEASQLAYAAPPMIILVVAAFVWPRSPGYRSNLLKTIGAGAAIFLSAVALFFVFLYSRSQLGGWWEFMQSLNDQAGYGALGAPLTQWFSFSPGLDAGFLVVTLLVLLGGILSISSSKFRPGLYAYLPLCLGVLGWILLQKQIVRSGIEAQIMFIPLLGLAILVVKSRAQSAGSLPPVTLSFCFALIFGCFVLEPGVWNALTARLRRVPDLPSNVSSAFFSNASWQEARSAYFAPSRLSFGEKTGIEIRNQINSLAPTGSNDPIYVLGNNSAIYALLDKKPPYCTYLYNLSPIDLQVRTVAWLQQNQPKYVFWDSAHKDFDGLPNEIRLPLVFTYVIEHYQPSVSFGDYQILKLMNPGEKPDFSYWTNHLGATTDLGFIPTASTLTVRDRGGEQTPALVVDVPQPAYGLQAKVVVDLGGRPYTILFREQVRHNTYVIRLDRIPVLAAGLASGQDLRLACCATGPVHAQIRTVFVPLYDLY